MCRAGQSLFLGWETLLWKAARRAEFVLYCCRAYCSKNQTVALYYGEIVADFIPFNDGQIPPAELPDGIFPTVGFYPSLSTAYCTVCAPSL